jgi:hypothetical protein
VFRSYQGVFEDPEEAFLLASLNPAANLSKGRWIGSNSQLSCALPEKVGGPIIFSEGDCRSNTEQRNGGKSKAE